MSLHGDIRMVNMVLTLRFVNYFGFILQWDQWEKFRVASKLISKQRIKCTLMLADQVLVLAYIQQYVVLMGFNGF